jgi:hypothetical protein
LEVLNIANCQAYVIEVTKADGTTEWLERRYSDFDYLHKEIEKKFGSYNFTKLPQKHLFGNLKKDVVQGRQVMLETYLQEVLCKSDVCKSDIFVRFLSSGAEKVRKALRQPIITHPLSLSAS